MRPRDINKEQSIREKALEMIVQEGFDGLSMKKLAIAAGVSPATIYIYFKDRDDLILQLCVDEHNKMAAATLQNFDPVMSFEEGLRIQWLNRATYCMKNPKRMHFIEQIRYSRFHQQVIHEVDQTFFRNMQAFVRNAINNDELKQIPVEVYWSLAFAPLYQLVKFHMSGKGMPGTGRFVLDQETMDCTLELVLKALKP